MLVMSLGITLLQKAKTEHVLSLEKLMVKSVNTERFNKQQQQSTVKKAFQ